MGPLKHLHRPLIRCWFDGSLLKNVVSSVALQPKKTHVVLALLQTRTMAWPDGSRYLEPAIEGFAWKRSVLFSFFRFGGWVGVGGVVKEE